MRHGPSVLSILLACTPDERADPDAASTTHLVTTDPVTSSTTTTDPPPTTTTDNPGTTTDATSEPTSTTDPTETTGAPEPACTIAGHPGECIDLTACPADATPFMTACAGPPAVQCCVPDAPPCSVDGAPGLCIATSDCTSPNLPTPGRCPGDAAIQCCTDPATACDPDVHPRPNDDLSEQPGDPGCPPGMARITTFCVDRYEAALLELDTTGTPLAGWSPYHNPGTARVRAVSLAHAVPQAYITQVQAAAACTEAGKRLCSDAEWLRACQGPETTTYPYGNTIKPGACNEARAVHPAIARAPTGSGPSSATPASPSSPPASPSPANI